MSKLRVLIVGCGGVGTIAALNLESGGKAAVTAVLRSNFNIVAKRGFIVRSIDYGHLEGWRPSQVVDKVPDVTGQQLAPFDYVVVTTKNIPDLRPALTELIIPAVTPEHTTIVLIQNGLNIEKPFLQAFPQNAVLSGVSFIDSHEIAPGEIEQGGHDSIQIGPFSNPNLDADRQESTAKTFIDAYAASGKPGCTYDADIGWARWRKLVFNGCLNPICAITRLDTGRIRLAEDTVATLVRPAMKEIIAAAAAAGHTLPDGIVETMIDLDPLQMYATPSMLEDAKKGNLIELENLVGEPLRVGQKLGVPMPTISLIYSLCKAIQWRMKEEKGLVRIPPKINYSSA